MSVLFDIYKASLNRPLIDPESTRLTEAADSLPPADQKLFSEEWLRLFGLCHQEGHGTDADSYERFEPVIVKGFTEKYGRA